MEVVAFLAPFVLLGVGVIFVAFSGGPGQAREAYLTKGGRFFRFSMVADLRGARPRRARPS